MMKLTQTELSCIEQTLDKHDIKYQEVYNELKDHLMSAVEYARASGDERGIDELLKHIISTQFPGWWPFEDVTKSFERAYRKKLWRSFGAIVKSYLNIETSVVALVMAASGLMLHAGKGQAIVLVSGIFIISAIPLFYAFYYARRIKAGKKRKSLVAGQLIGISYVLMSLINVIFNLGRLIDKNSWWAFLNPAHYAPVVFTTLFTLFLIYGMSSIKLVRREYQAAVL